MLKNFIINTIIKIIDIDKNPYARSLNQEIFLSGDSVLTMNKTIPNRNKLIKLLDALFFIFLL